MATIDKQTFRGQDPAIQRLFENVWGADAERKWEEEHNAALRIQRGEPSSVNVPPTVSRILSQGAPGGAADISTRLPLDVELRPPSLPPAPLAGGPPPSPPPPPPEPPPPEPPAPVTDDPAYSEAKTRGATDQTAADIVNFLRNNEGERASFMAGTNPNVIWGVKPPPKIETQDATTPSTPAIVPSPGAAVVDPGVGVVPPVATGIAPENIIPRTASVAEQRLQELANAIANTEDERRLVEAATQEIEQAREDARLRQTSAQILQDQLQMATRPGVGLFSLFSQRRPPGEMVPLPADIGALLQQRNIPVAGNIPGGQVFLSPDQINTELFRDAVRGLTAQNIRALSSDPTSLANFQAFGNLAGADPLRALQGIQATLPSQASLRGSVLV